MSEQHSLTEYKIPGGLEEHAIGQFIETSLDDLRSLAEAVTYKQMRFTSKMKSAIQYSYAAITASMH